jgi:hypothetical protein
LVVYFLKSPIRLTLFVATSLWGLGIASGVMCALAYQYTPAERGLAHSHWPAATSCVLASDRPTLIMFVHPRCPCSRASLSELELLTTHCAGRLDAQVLFLQPPALPTDWVESDLWNRAAKIPGVVRRLDFEGGEQRLFGARVSGEVFVYSPDGKLLFHGGITAGRGHVGDNAGRSALESLLLRSQNAGNITPVFGCQLEASGRGSSRTAAVRRKAER